MCMCRQRRRFHEKDKVDGGKSCKMHADFRDGLSCYVIASNTTRIDGLDYLNGGF